MKSDPRRLRRRLRGDLSRYQTEKPRRPRQRHPRKNSRRLPGMQLVGSSWKPPFPVLVSAVPRNAGQWTLLPSHEQAQHLTPAVSRAQGPERGTSEGCWASAPGRGSAQTLPAAAPAHTATCTPMTNWWPKNGQRCFQPGKLRSMTRIEQATDLFCIALQACRQLDLGETRLTERTI